MGGEMMKGKCGEEEIAIGDELYLKITGFFCENFI
jgi:hypothetical protein